MHELFLSILSSALLPILVIVALGFGLQRWRPMDASTLVTLNLYLFVPVYLFVRVLESNLRWSNIAQIGIAVLVPMLCVGGLAWFLLPRFVSQQSTRAALVVGSIFANCGNFGMPVAELAFGRRGGEVHAIIVMFLNFSIFSVAYTILAMGRGQGMRAVLNYFRLPYLYCILAAILLRDMGWKSAVPEWIHQSCQRIADGLVPVALVTLGAQLARNARFPQWGRLIPALVLKLLVLPGVALLTVRGLGLWPWPGVVIVLAASAPTAINTLFLAMQLDGDSDTMSDCVFWSTLCSALSVAVWLTLLRSLAPDSFLQGF